MAAFNLTVNGRSRTVSSDPETPLLYLLMHDLELNGPKFGCGLAECGACTVLIDGEPARSCITPVSEAEGHEVTTIEGLGTIDQPHPIQTAFIEEQAVQCGYCLSGPMLYGKAYIDQNPAATEPEILEALTGLLCRCHTHGRMVKALLRYAEGVRA
ncbi:MAG TPA: (2Fe-2S)-binding protein [Bryobacteraceae bacterium]|nr:(2Fe-2S)-binding protein [Bryobacteraceae bacterium]